MAGNKAQLEKMLEAEVDRRFELDILDRLRGKRLQPLAQVEQKVETKEEEGMSDDELAMLQALGAQGDDNVA